MQETMTLANAHPVTHPSPITPADCKAAAKRLRDRAPGRAPDTADLPKLDRRSAGARLYSRPRSLSSADACSHYQQ